MKKLLFLLLLSAAAFGQSISQYQYVIVPSKFDAQKKAGQFGLNNLTKLFLEKNGYTVFYDTDILPSNVSGESCNKIYANVISDNTFRKTRLRVEIKDCRNAVLFTSDYGESDEKDFNVSYNQALRAAFKSFDKPEYHYNPAASIATGKTAVDAQPKASNQAAKITSEVLPDAVGMLTAQEISGGYQLIDTTPKVIFRLFATSNPDVLLADRNGTQGVFLKKDGRWFFEFRQDSRVISEPINVKF